MLEDSKDDVQVLGFEQQKAGLALRKALADETCAGVGFFFCHALDVLKQNRGKGPATGSLEN